MLKKKEEEIAPIDPSSVKKWPDEDTKRLEDYCAKMGIIGFGTKMNPISALAEFFLYFNRAFRQKLFYSSGSLHSTIPLLAGNGIDDLSDSLGPDWASSYCRISTS
jgi:hypothetical protein